MKQNVPPIVVAIVIVAVLALIGVFYIRGSSGSKNAADIEKTIQAGLAGGGTQSGAGKGPSGPMTGPPPGVMPRPGGNAPPISTMPPLPQAPR